MTRSCHAIYSKMNYLISNQLAAEKEKSKKYKGGSKGGTVCEREDFSLSCRPQLMKLYGI